VTARALETVAVADVAPHAWANGGGCTRTLLAWPDASAWTLRISVADIDRDGPFSPLPGVARWFAVIGRGEVRLAFGPRTVRHGAGDGVLPFDGGAPPVAALADGPVRALNTMVRDAQCAGHHAMTAAVPGVGWRADGALRAVYAATAGRLLRDDHSLDLDADTLTWASAAKDETWTWQPAAPATSYWIASRGAPIASL